MASKALKLTSPDYAGKVMNFLIAAQGEAHTDVYEKVKNWPETAEEKQKLYLSVNTCLACSSLDSLSHQNLIGGSYSVNLN